MRARDNRPAHLATSSADDALLPFAVVQRSGLCTYRPAIQAKLFGCNIRHATISAETETAMNDSKGGPDWARDWQALQRQYWTAWSDLTRNQAGAEMPDPSTPWHEG